MFFNALINMGVDKYTCFMQNMLIIIATILSRIFSRITSKVLHDNMLKAQHGKAQKATTDGRNDLNITLLTVLTRSSVQLNTRNNVNRSASCSHTFRYWKCVVRRVVQASPLKNILCGLPLARGRRALHQLCSWPASGLWDSTYAGGNSIHINNKCK